MKQRVLTFAAVLSLIFCAALIWRWTGSIGADSGIPQFTFPTGANSAVSVYLYHYADIDVFHSKLAMEGGRAPGDLEQYDANYIQRYELAGLAFERDMATPPCIGHYVADRSGDPGPCHWHIELPIWMLALGSLILPCWQTGAYFPRRNRLDGHCIRCGYDLRATPERCPECGTSADRVRG